MTILTSGGFFLHVDVNDDLLVGTDVEAAVRPEKIHLSTDFLQGENTFSGLVVDHAFLGATTRYFVQLDSGKQIMVLRQNHGAASDRLLPCGERVSVSWGRAWVKVFPNAWRVPSAEPSGFPALKPLRRG